jgi:hypothetical protein
MRVRRKIFSSLFACFLLCLAVLLSSAPCVWAQLTDAGSVVGQITDPSNAVISGATVTLTDTETSASRTAQTNDAGRYTFANVRPGVYNIAVTKTGFATTKSERQQVTVGSTLTVNLALQVGAANVVVEVTAAGNELQTTDATVGQTINGSALDSLPGLGRDVSTFVTLQPGVAPDGSVAGANQDQNSFQLDGGNNSSDMDGTQNTYTASFASDPTGGLINNEVTGTAPGGSPGGGGPTGVMPTPADSIEEFRVGTNNQTADFNSSAGAQVRLVTKRGTNQWHGTAYEYYLDNNWASNSFDNTSNGVRRPSYHYSRFGGSVGGPLIPMEILGGKTYFFVNYEGFRWPNSATTTRATPSADMRLGLLTTGGTTYNLNPYPVTSAEGVVYAANANCTAANGFASGVCDPQHLGISPTMQTLWTSMPATNTGLDKNGLANCSGLSRCDHFNVQAFSANYPVKWNDNFGVVRLDHDFGARWHFYSTYRYYRQQRGTGNQIDITGGKPVSTSARPSWPWYLTASVNTNITTNLTNDFHYSFLRNYWQRSSLGDPVQVPGLGGALEPEGETASQVLAPLNLDTQNVRTRFWDGKDHMIRDDVSWLKGSHFFTFGGLYQHNFNYHQRTDNGGGINYQTVYRIGDGIGSTNGMDMTGYVPTVHDSSSKWARDYASVLGAVGVTQIAYTRTGSNLNLNPPNTPAFDQSTIPFYNLYVNDSWRMKPSFTLSYGLGWALEMPPTEKNGKQVAFVDANNHIIDTQAFLNARRNAALAGQVYNPEVGFNLIGNVAGRPRIYNPYYKSFSPRIAAAWNPHFDSDSMMGKVFGHNSTVLRGGYSILYGRLNGVDLVLVPLLGTGLIQAVQCVSPTTTGSCPGISTPATSFRIGPSGSGFGGLVAPLPAASATLPQPDFPGYNAIAAGAGEGIDPNFRPSVNQQYDLTIQRQLTKQMSIEVGYIGRHMTHEFQPIQVNAVPYMMTLGGQRFDKAYGQMVMQYCGGNAGLAGGNCANNLSAVTAQPFFENALAGTGYCTGFTNCTQAVASNEAGNIASASVWSLWSDLDAGVGCPKAGCTSVNGGTGAFAFSRSMMNTPIPGSTFGAAGQLTSGVGLNTSLGYGNYNAMFVSYKMTAWKGFTLQSNFTWSKALGTGSQVQATSQYSINDPFDYARSYGYQPWDRKFLFNVWFTYQPPVFQGQHGVLGRVLGGWTFAPILDTGSGIPFGIYPVGFGSSAYTGGQEFGGMDGGNIGSYVNAVPICSVSLSTSRHNHFNDGGGTYGTATNANLFSDPGAVYNCFRNPILGVDNGHNGGTGNYRGQPFWNVDFSIKKNILVTERFSAELGAVFTNIFNHNQLFDPGVTFLSDQGDFGSLEGGSGAQQVNNPRKIEVAVRLRF